jgi:hypothetical protein
MTRAFLFPAALLVAAFAAEVAAQPSEPSARLPVDLAPITRDGALGRADSLYGQLDLDHDGILTRSEALQAMAQLRAERRVTGKDVAPGIGGHTARFLERRFLGVQSITRQQFEQAMLAHFDAMDLDHDGILSTQEREQSRSGARRSGQ